MSACPVSSHLAQSHLSVAPQLTALGAADQPCRAFSRDLSHRTSETSVTPRQSRRDSACHDGAARKAKVGPNRPRHPARPSGHRRDGMPHSPWALATFPGCPAPRPTRWLRVGSASPPRPPKDQWVRPLRRRHRRDALAAARPRLCGECHRSRPRPQRRGSCRPGRDACSAAFLNPLANRSDGPRLNSATAEWTVGARTLQTKLCVGRDGELRSVVMPRWGTPMATCGGSTRAAASSPAKSTSAGSNFQPRCGPDGSSIPITGPKASSSALRSPRLGFSNPSREPRACRAQRSAGARCTAVPVDANTAKWWHP